MPKVFKGEELVGANALTVNMSQEEMFRRATTNYSDEQMFTNYTTTNDPINPNTNEAEVQSFEENATSGGGIPQLSEPYKTTKTKSFSGFGTMIGSMEVPKIDEMQASGSLYGAQQIPNNTQRGPCQPLVPSPASWPGPAAMSYGLSPFSSAPLPHASGEHANIYSSAHTLRNEFQYLRVEANSSRASEEISASYPSTPAFEGPGSNTPSSATISPSPSSFSPPNAQDNHNYDSGTEEVRSKDKPAHRKKQQTPEIQAVIKKHCVQKYLNPNYHYQFYPEMTPLECLQEMIAGQRPSDPSPPTTEEDVAAYLAATDEYNAPIRNGFPAMLARLTKQRREKEKSAQEALVAKAKREGKALAAAAGLVRTFKLTKKAAVSKKRSTKGNRK